MLDAVKNHGARGTHGHNPKSSIWYESSCSPPHLRDFLSVTAQITQAVGSESYVISCSMGISTWQVTKKEKDIKRLYLKIVEQDRQVYNKLRVQFPIRDSVSFSTSSSIKERAMRLNLFLVSLTSCIDHSIYKPLSKFLEINLCEGYNTFINGMVLLQSLFRRNKISQQWISVLSLAVRNRAVILYTNLAIKFPSIWKACGAAAGLNANSLSVFDIHSLFSDIDKLSVDDRERGLIARTAGGGMDQHIVLSSGQHGHIIIAENSRFLFQQRRLIDVYSPSTMPNFSRSFGLISLEKKPYSLDKRYVSALSTNFKDNKDEVYEQIQRILETVADDILQELADQMSLFEVFLGLGKPPPPPPVQQNNAYYYDDYKHAHSLL